LRWTATDGGAMPAGGFGDSSECGAGFADSFFVFPASAVSGCVASLGLFPPTIIFTAAMPAIRLNAAAVSTRAFRFEGCRPRATAILPGSDDGSFGGNGAGVVGAGVKGGFAASLASGFGGDAPVAGVGVGVEDAGGRECGVWTAGEGRAFTGTSTAIGSIREPSNWVIRS
jgi:hypothetical protein